MIDIIKGFFKKKVVVKSKLEMEENDRLEYPKYLSKMEYVINNNKFENTHWSFIADVICIEDMIEDICGEKIPIGYQMSVIERKEDGWLILTDCRFKNRFLPSLDYLRYQEHFITLSQYRAGLREDRINKILD